MADFTPTDEQAAALAMFTEGDSMVVEAGAGTGKTSTLLLLAESTPRRGRYIAFNKAIVVDVAGKMPPNVAASTAHSIAFRAVGKDYGHRLNSPRMKGSEIARVLDVPNIGVAYGVQTKMLDGWYLAGHVLRAVTRFCQTADLEPAVSHFEYIEGIDLPTEDGRRTYENNDAVRARLLPAVRKAWDDFRRPDGTLPFRHDHYLKMWALSDPKSAVDFILFDEAQDANPVLADVIERQTHAQRVYVGDRAQSIYGFTGAVDAMSTFVTDRRAVLSQSFRFGQAIADRANEFLALLDTPLRLSGNPAVTSTVGPLDGNPNAVLTRTNATAVGVLLSSLKRGLRPHIVGGGTEVLAFARAALKLKEDGFTSHPDLACFRTWGEVQEYCVAIGTRVLTSDLRWIPAEDLAPGDSLIGFDEENEPGASGRKYRPSTVTTTDVLRLPCVAITADDGTTVTVSTDHRWLVRSGRNLRWKRSSTIRPGDAIVSLGAPWEIEETRAAGWLAGLYDGEGSVIGGAGQRSRSKAIVIAQRPGDVLTYAKALLDERGYAYTERQSHGSDCRHLELWGGLSRLLRLLGTIRPIRLLPKADRLWDGARVEARIVATVVSVEDVGEQDVVSLGTTTKTFVAEGWLSHNCERDAQGHELRLLVNLVDEFGCETILESVGNMPSENAADVVISTAHKAKGREWKTVRLADDFDPAPESDDEIRLQYVAATRAKEHLDAEALDAVEEFSSDPDYV